MLRFEKSLVYPKMVEIDRLIVLDGAVGVGNLRMVRRDWNRDTTWYAPRTLAWLYRLLPRWVGFRKIPPEPGVGYFTTAIQWERACVGLVDRGRGFHFLLKIGRWELRTWSRHLWQQTKRPVLEYTTMSTDGGFTVERGKTFGPAPMWKPITIGRGYY